MTARQAKRAQIIRTQYARIARAQSVTASVFLLLSSCTPAQVTTSMDAVVAACTDIRPLLSLAALIPQVGTIADYVRVGCDTADGLARLAADPSSAEWLGAQRQRILDLAARANIKF